MTSDTRQLAALSCATVAPVALPMEESVSFIRTRYTTQPDGGLLHTNLDQVIVGVVGSEATVGVRVRVGVPVPVGEKGC